MERAAPQQVPAFEKSEHAQRTQPVSKQEIFEDSVSDMQLSILKMLVEEWTGREVTLYTGGPQACGEDTCDEMQAQQPDTASPGTTVNEGADNASSASRGASTSPERQGWGVSYRYRRVTHTRHEVSFNAAGEVTTQQGDTLSFSASLQMTRETYEEVSLHFKAGDALIDPLVVNYAAPYVSLHGKPVMFDLDNDGTAQRIATPGTGSGFLAYDKNGNARIDHGEELFGPATGSGFGELQRLDKDGNGWVDENDPEFDSLFILTFDTAGTQRLQALGDMHIGALSLAHRKTHMPLDAPDGTAAGVLGHTGIFLTEEGTAGTLQEIDLKG
jgi:hypothetical protein